MIIQYHLSFNGKSYHEQKKYQLIQNEKISESCHIKMFILIFYIWFLSGYKTGTVNVYRPTVVEAQEGENVTIECVAIGLPQPNISWEKYGGKLPSKRTETIQGE